MARLRWVVDRMRNWAAWIESYGNVRSPIIDGLPVGHRPQDWLPPDTRVVRQTNKALCRLPREHQTTLVLVYLIGPRAHRISIDSIAAMSNLNRETLRQRVWAAEKALSEAIDEIDEQDDAID